MKRFLSLLLCVLVFCISCNKNKWDYSRESMDPRLRIQMRAMDDTVFAAIQKLDYTAFSALLSDTFKSTLPLNFQQDMFPKLQGCLNMATRHIFDELYIETSAPGQMLTANVPFGDSSYILQFIPTAHKTFVSMVILTDSNNNSNLFALVYGNYNSKWKIIGIHVDNYAINGMSALDLFTKAKRLYNEGDDLDAFVIMHMYDTYKAPADDLFKYNKNEEANAFAKSVDSTFAGRYTLPYILTGLKTKPQILGANYRVVQRGWALVIGYLTTINLSDTVALKKENDEIQQKIPTLFPGVIKNNDMILYEALNQKPEDGQPLPLSYNFVYRKTP